MLGEVSVYIDMDLDTSSDEGLVREDLLVVKVKAEHERERRARIVVAVDNGRIFDGRIVFGCVIVVPEVLLM